ncbi:hypothetical protein [Flavobacterium sp. MK4S-17]|uniref:hypothetical protein n=1 Tax=Flavobacterium sp. MK4S-17 TaxID=2543737 RepID=UPI00135CDE1A|nr:hypothetical protein [Flavobacterium sp. MK4S-17]
MKKILHQLTLTDLKIKECQKEIEAVKQLPFYKIFGSEAQRKNDVDSLQLFLHSLLQEKRQLLKQLKACAGYELSQLKNFIKNITQ